MAISDDLMGASAELDAVLAAPGRGGVPSTGAGMPCSSVMGTRTIIEAVAGIIAEGYPGLPWAEVVAVNKRDGWTIEGQFEGMEYVAESDYTRMAGVELAREDLAAAWSLAMAWSTR